MKRSHINMTKNFIKNQFKKKINAFISINTFAFVQAQF